MIDIPQFRTDRHFAVRLGVDNTDFSKPSNEVGVGTYLQPPCDVSGGGEVGLFGVGIKIQVH